MPNLNLVISTFGLKTAKNGFQVILAVLFYSLSFFFRKESNAITVLATVATQVTTAITNSKVITSLPIQLFQQKLIRVGRHRLKLGISNVFIITSILYSVNIKFLGNKLPLHFLYISLDNISSKTFLFLLK